MHFLFSPYSSFSDNPPLSHVRNAWILSNFYSNYYDFAMWISNNFLLTIIPSCYICDIKSYTSKRIQIEEIRINLLLIDFIVPIVSIAMNKFQGNKISNAKLNMIVMETHKNNDIARVLKTVTRPRWGCFCFIFGFKIIDPLLIVQSNSIAVAFKKD